MRTWLLLLSPSLFRAGRRQELKVASLGGGKRGAVLGEAGRDREKERAHEQI